MQGLKPFISSIKYKKKFYILSNHLLPIRYSSEQVATSPRSEKMEPNYPAVEPLTAHSFDTGQTEAGPPSVESPITQSFDIR